MTTWLIALKMLTVLVCSEFSRQCLPYVRKDHLAKGGIPVDILQFSAVFLVDNPKACSRYTMLQRARGVWPCIHLWIRLLFANAMQLSKLGMLRFSRIWRWCDLIGLLSSICIALLYNLSGFCHWWTRPVTMNQQSNLNEVLWGNKLSRVQCIVSGFVFICILVDHYVILSVSAIIYLQFTS